MNTVATNLVCNALAQHLAIDPDEVLASHHLDTELGLDPLDLVLIALRLEEGAAMEFPARGSRGCTPSRSSRSSSRRGSRATRSRAASCAVARAKRSARGMVGATVGARGLHNRQRGLRTAATTVL